MFLDLGIQLVAALPGAFPTVFDWFTGLPLLIFDLFMLGIQTILDLGGKIVTSILDGIVAGAQTLWDWIAALPKAILDLFIARRPDLPRHRRLDHRRRSWTGIIAIAQTLWDWFTGLPGRCSICSAPCRRGSWTSAGRSSAGSWTGSQVWDPGHRLDLCVPENFARSFDIFIDAILARRRDHRLDRGRAHRSVITGHRLVAEFPENFMLAL